MLNIVR